MYNFASAGLLKTARAVVACCIVKSSADIREIDDNTLRVLVNQCFETSELELRKAIYAELHQAIFDNKDPAYKAALQAARDAAKTKLVEFAAPRAIVNAA